MWAQLKNGFRRKNVKLKFDRAVINLITEEVANISAEEWQKKIKKVIEYEDSYRSLGDTSMIRKGNDQFIVDLREESDFRTRRNL
jgi:hypothetical protein